MMVLLFWLDVCGCFVCSWSWFILVELAANTGKVPTRINKHINAIFFTIFLPLSPPCFDLTSF
jgi:arginine exporter protein ArgO